MINENNKKEDCCSNAKIEHKGFWSGLIYGLLPHTGCIAFIIFTIFGVTTATAMFKPLLMSRYFFHGLILLSFVFATVSAIIYLKKNNMFSLKGMKQKWKYLSILYGTSIGINLLLFIVVFPITANMTGAVVAVESLDKNTIEELTLQVEIPCPGHAPLISNSLKELPGVKSVTFRFPNYFDVIYNPSEISQEDILKIEEFVPYPATIIKGVLEVETSPQPQGCSNCGGCSGACGGTCGG